MKKMMFLSKNWYFSVQKVLIYYTVHKSHQNSFILLVFSHVANFRYAASFTFLTLTSRDNGTNSVKTLVVMEMLVGNTGSLIMTASVALFIQKLVYNSLLLLN